MSERNIWDNSDLKPEEDLQEEENGNPLNFSEIEQMNSLIEERLEIDEVMAKLLEYEELQAGDMRDQDNVTVKWSPDVMYGRALGSFITQGNLVVSIVPSTNSPTNWSFSCKITVGSRSPSVLQEFYQQFFGNSSDENLKIELVPLASGNYYRLEISNPKFLRDFINRLESQPGVQKLKVFENDIKDRAYFYWQAFFKFIEKRPVKTRNDLEYLLRLRGGLQSQGGISSNAWTDENIISGKSTITKTDTQMKKGKCKPFQEDL